MVKAAPEQLRLATQEERTSTEMVSQVLRKAQHQLGSGRRGAFKYHDITTEEVPTEADANRTLSTADTRRIALGIEPGHRIVLQRDAEERRPENSSGSGGPRPNLTESAPLTDGPPEARRPAEPDTASPEEAGGAELSSSSSSSSSSPGVVGTTRPPSRMTAKHATEMDEARGQSSPEAGPEPTQAEGSSSGEAPMEQGEARETPGSPKRPREESPSSTARNLRPRGWQPTAFGSRFGRRAAPAAPATAENTTGGGSSSSSSVPTPNVMEILAAERRLVRSDSTWIGDEDEYDVDTWMEKLKTKPNIDEKDMMHLIGDYFDEMELFDVVDFVGLTTTKAGVVHERDLTAVEMLEFNKAKLKEFQKVVFEKKALRILTPEESARVRANNASRIISSTFALKYKEENETTDPTKLTKEAHARLAVRGCADPDLRDLGWNNQTQAPTLSAEARMLLLQLVASNGLTLSIGDVRGAFMEAPPLNRRGGKLYMSLPRGRVPGSKMQSDQLLEIILQLYGLNDSPQCWWGCCEDVCTKAGFTQSKFDKCLYMTWDIVDGEKKLTGVLGHHVDDFIGGGSGEKHERAIAQLRKRFPFRRWSLGGGDFCGSRLRQEKDGSIFMVQTEFAEKMRPIPVPKGVDPTAECPPTGGGEAAPRSLRKWELAGEPNETRFVCDGVLEHASLSTPYMEQHHRDEQHDPPLQGSDGARGYLPPDPDGRADLAGLE